METVQNPGTAERHTDLLASSEVELMETLEFSLLIEMIMADF